MSTETEDLERAMVRWRERWELYIGETLSDVEVRHLSEAGVEPGFNDFASMEVLRAFQAGVRSADATTAALRARVAELEAGSKVEWGVRLVHGEQIKVWVWDDAQAARRRVESSPALRLMRRWVGPWVEVTE